jgi:hypothetical protein
MIRYSISVIALGCLMATGAQAVHLSDLEGPVLINGKKVAVSSDVVAGDRVKAVSGSVKIVYDNGSVVNVAKGQTVVVAQTPPDPPVQPSSAGSDGAGGPLAGTDGVVAVAGVAAIGVGVGLGASHSNPESP